MQQSTDKTLEQGVYCREANWDIVVIGDGPSGLIIANQCALSDFKVLVLSKDNGKKWTNNYCFWKSELDVVRPPKPMQNLFNECIEMVWNTAQVHLRNTTRVDIDAPFAKFDSLKLQQHLQELATESGIQLQTGEVTTIEQLPSHSVVHTANHTYTARVVIAANGSSSNLLQYSTFPKPGYQIAYGQVLDVSNFDIPWTLDTMSFMDFRFPTKHHKFFQSPPSFLYVLPLSTSQVFLEETILATRESVDFEMLKERLQLRKETFGLGDAPVLDQEFCRIEMGGSLPKTGRTLAFGASAGFTHPVTGFQILRSIYTAPRLVATLKEHWSADTETLCTEAWKAIWNDTERRNRKLYLLGLDMIVRFNLRETQNFFEAFFKSSPEARASFLSGFGSTQAVQSSMWETFKHADWTTRAKIVQHSSQHPTALFSALFDQLSNLETS